MPIVHRTSLNAYVAQLEKRYKSLIEELKGNEPNPNIYHLYHDNPEQYEKEFREVNELDVKLAAHDFEGIIKELKNLKSIKAKTKHSVR